MSAAALPILFVPGVLGTTLVDASRRSLVWGSAQGLLRLRRDPERLEPGAVLWRFQVIPGLHAVPVYEPLARTLEALGYPRAGAGGGPRLHGLAYDWRRDMVSAAQALETAVLRITSAPSAPRVYLVGHSWGCDVIRYYLRYGGADLASGGEAQPPRPGASRVAGVFAIGPLYEGTLRALHEANHGFAVAPFGLGVGPHQAAMAECLYDVLAYGTAAVDAEARPVALDLASAATWRELGFGPFREASFERLLARARRHAPDLGRAALAERLEGFLERNLSRGQRLWRLLRTPHPADGQVRTVTYTAGDEPTLTRLVLSGKGGRRVARASAEAVRRHHPELLASVTAPGDGYVTVEQVRARAAAGARADGPEHVPEGSYLFVAEGCTHRELARHPGLLRNLALSLSAAAAGPA